MTDSNAQDLLANIPDEIKMIPSWVGWKFQCRPGNSKPTKVPVNPKTGLPANVMDNSTWSTFDEAVSSINKHGCDGIGFVFSRNDPYCGIDLDDTDGDETAYQRQQAIFRDANSYTELSPSGTGVHIIVKGSIPQGKRRASIEVYSEARFFTMTGNVIHNVGIANCQPLLDVLFSEMGGEKADSDASPHFAPATESDDAVLATANAAKNGEKFADLWAGNWQRHYPGPGQSEADFALINMLGFYTPNPKQIARLFRQSALGQRAKASRDNYVMPMVSKAMDNRAGNAPENFTVNGQAFKAGIKASDPQPSPHATQPLLIDAGTWAGMTPQPRKWIVPGFIPLGHVTLCMSPGGVGKSLLTQQLCSSTALGTNWLADGVMHGPALYVTCEDSANELHERQISICGHLKRPLADLSGKLFHAVLTGCAGNELVRWNHRGEMTITESFERLKATILQCKAILVVLDNVAHFFPGDENNRNQVAPFLGSLERLAAETGAAIVLIAHTNKSGGQSGSTAWTNQVRNTISLTVPQEPNGFIPDRDRRVLTVEKSNYSRPGNKCQFRWHEGVFKADAELPTDVAEAINAVAQSSLEDQTFLACLAKATEERRATSSSSSASNYAPKLFATMQTANGIKKAGFEAAMQRLFHNGIIVNGQNVYQRDNRAWVTGIGLAAPTLAPTPAPTPAQGCTDPSEEPQNSADEIAPTCTHSPPIL